MKASFKVWAVIEPLAPAGEAQYSESTIVEALPEYPGITSNVQAKALQQVGLEIISMVSCEHNMHYVCVCQDQKYLLSLSKIPKALKQQVTDYRLWHMSNFNCLPEDFECREKRAARPVITRYPNKLCSMVVGETVQKRVVAEHVRVRSLLEKVTAKDLDLFDNAMVTQLVETNLKGRK